MVRTLKGLLGDDTGLFKQIWQKQETLGLRTKRRGKKWLEGVSRILTGLDISSSQFTGGSEVDTDEFTLSEEEGRF